MGLYVVFDVYFEWFFVFLELTGLNYLFFNVEVGKTLDHDVFYVLNVECFETLLSEIFCLPNPRSPIKLR